MKAIKSNGFLGFCIVAALLCSCSEELEEPFAGGDRMSPILLDAGIEASVESRADLDGPVSGTTFPANTTKVCAVSVYKGSAAPTTNWSGAYFENYTVNSGTSSVLSFSSPQYYPANGDKLYFYAYSPGKDATYTMGNATTAPTVKWTISGSQDIMHAKVTTGIAKNPVLANQQQPTFAFTHKLKQLKFKIVKDASFEDNIKLTSLKIIGVKTTPTMNLNTGALSWASTTGDLTVYSNTTGQAITSTATAVGSALMIEPGTTFKVRAVAGGLTYADATVTLTGTNAGNAGVSHEVTLTFKRSTIQPKASITNWTTGTAANVPIV